MSKIYKAINCKNFKPVGITTVGDLGRVESCGQLLHCTDATKCDKTVESPLCGPELGEVCYEDNKVIKL